MSRFCSCFRLALAAASLFLVAGLAAQPSFKSPTTPVPVLAFPTQDNAALLAEELRLRDTPDRAPHFALTQATNISPATGGAWEELPGGRSVWRLRVNSPNAKSLNLGFTEFYLPPGGELYLYPANRKQPEVLGPFTPADNEEHNQLWTPIVPTDDLMIELRVPTAQKSFVRLRLTDVNHDFVGFASSSLLSGSCNLDVICGAEDGWGIVDGYRDIIQSVAVYSTGGSTFCTGFLVNNARQDCKPFFMTANHCGVANAGPSLVVYWNFINSVCRQPGSSASGGGGNGTLNSFNTGSIFRATYPNSDMTLVELDDPVVDAANAFYAGWDTSLDPPMDTIIAIHHPSTDEKRITFSFQDTYRANGISSTPAAGGTHITIPDWNIGTTEGGSSGSPVFDRFKRVRGQLHGGGAACGNDDFDSYGFFGVSWEGGGTNSTRLKNWLDPDNTGITQIDGRFQLACSSGIFSNNATQSACATDALVFNISAGAEFNGPVSLGVGSLPAGVTATFAQTSIPAGGGTTLNVQAPAGFSGSFVVVVTGNGDGTQVTTELTANFTGNPPAAPAAQQPANGAMNIGITPTLSWQSLPGVTNYRVQISTSTNFTAPLIDQTLTGTNLTSPVLLSATTTYYWRVRAANICGPGAWSATRSFTTANITCAVAASDDVPVAISPDGDEIIIISTLSISNDATVSNLEVTVEIDHTFVGDLTALLTSPSGTTVLLFANAGDFCPGENLLLTFSDQAGQTSDDLNEACDFFSNPTLEGTFQPVEPLAIFSGESAEGVWVLEVEDNADADGGALVAWSIDLCSSGTTTAPNLSLSYLDTPGTICPGDLVQFELQLGSDYTAGFQTAVTLNGTPFTNASVSYLEDIQRLLVTLLFLETPGTYDVSIGLTQDGTTTSASSNFTIQALPAFTLLQFPPPATTFQAGQVLNFGWQLAANTVDYEFQIATDEAFTNVVFSTITTGNTLVLNDFSGEGQHYWRVKSRNQCGDSVPSPNGFFLQPSAVHDLGAGRQLAVLPNPTAGPLFLRLTGNWAGVPLEVNIHDLTGRLVLQRTFPISLGEHSLDLSRLPSGTYLLAAVVGSERVIERIVVY